MSIATSFIDAICNFNVYSVAILVPVLVFLAHFIPWLVDFHGIRSYPGPLLAKFSDLWLAWIAAHGHRSEVVHDLHKEYGM